MQLTVQLSEESAGNFRALCPELGITAYGTDPRAAIDKLKTKILDCVTRAGNAYYEEMKFADGYTMGGAMSVLRAYALLTGEEGVKLFYIPDQATQH
jgi:hypothetical protein